MPSAASNGITIAYELSGPPDGPPLLLIHGVGAQLVRWPQALCDKFAEAGFRVIRYDNRDVGLSTHMDGAPVPDLATVTAFLRRGETPSLPYTLADLTADAIGLLDALNIPQAHVFGVSLGGMIAQCMAITAPQRTLSLAVVMSTSGNLELPGASPTALQALSAIPPNPAHGMEAYLQHSVALNQTLGSPAYPTPIAELRDFAARAAARAYDPAGAARQLAAGRGAPDRREALQQLTLPTLVIHGADDPLLPAVCGEDIAQNIKAAWLLKLNGMGHDLPAALCDIIVQAAAANTRRAENLKNHPEMSRGRE